MGCSERESVMLKKFCPGTQGKDSTAVGPGSKEIFHGKFPLAVQLSDFSWHQEGTAE